MESEANMKKSRHKWRKLVLLLLATTLVSLGISVAYIQHLTYQPSRPAKTALKVAKVNHNATTFTAHPNKLTVIFYPGALVNPNSYSIWAQQVANAGYTVKIAHFPLNLAIFSANKASELVDHNEKYVIGGHSLGGVMAAHYAHQNQGNNLKGAFFLASYPDEKGRLDQTNLPVLSITAKNDGVLNWKNYRKSQKFLPTNTNFFTIEGGNHGGFGSYGQQRGDKVATISNADQQKQLANQLILWLNQITH